MLVANNVGGRLSLNGGVGGGGRMRRRLCEWTKEVDKSDGGPPVRLQQVRQSASKDPADQSLIEARTTADYGAPSRPTSLLILIQLVSCDLTSGETQIAEHPWED